MRVGKRIDYRNVPNHGRSTIRHSDHDQSSSTPSTLRFFNHRRV
jgi:hypothetical protein